MPPDEEEAKVCAAYARTFEGDNGGFVLSHLMVKFGFMGSTEDVASNSHQMAFREGQRSVVVHILNAMRERQMEATEMVGRLTQAEIDYYRDLKVIPPAAT